MLLSDVMAHDTIESHLEHDVLFFYEASVDIKMI